MKFWYDVCAKDASAVLLKIYHQLLESKKIKRFVKWFFIILFFIIIFLLLYCVVLFNLRFILIFFNLNKPLPGSTYCNGKFC